MVDAKFTILPKYYKQIPPINIIMAFRSENKPGSSHIYLYLPCARLLPDANFREAGADPQLRTSELQQVASIPKPVVSVASPEGLPFLSRSLMLTRAHWVCSTSILRSFKHLW